MTYDKIVLVTRKTRLANLIDRFNTMDQARFYLVQAGLDFSDYAREDDAYERALAYLKRSLELRDVQQQTIDRSLLPTFRFAPGDLVVTLGGNGLVANTAADEIAMTFAVMPSSSLTTVGNCRPIIRNANDSRISCRAFHTALSCSRVA